MVRQIIVFTKSSLLPSIQGLIDAAKTLEISITPFNPFEETFWPTDEAYKLPERLATFSQNLPTSKAGSNVETHLIVRTSGILFDDIDLLLAQELERQGVKTSISIGALKLMRDKSAQALWLKNNQVPFVPTLNLRGKLDRESLLKWSQKHQAQQTQQNKDQFIIKSIRGNKGIGVKKFTSEELFSFWDQCFEHQDQRYVIQPYFENCRELRLLCLGERSFFIEKDKPSDLCEFRRNSQYSQFRKYEPEDHERQELKDMAETIQKELNCPSFALDLLKVGETWKVLEMNASPGISSAQKVFPQENLYEHYLRSLF